MKEIEGLPDYFVTREGKVFSNKGGIIKERKLTPDKYGYIRLSFYVNGKLISKRIHRLVAKTFIPNPDNKKFVNHVNGIKSENNVENLEWCTFQENMRHSFDNGLHVPAKGTEHYGSKLTEENVLFIRDVYPDGNFSQNELADMFNVSRRAIRNALDGKSWKHI